MKSGHRRQRTARSTVRLVCASVLFAAGVVCHVMEMFDAAILAAGGAYLALYTDCDSGDRQGWLADPLRIALPLFVVFQLVFWLRCMLAAQGLRVFGYEFAWVGYSVDAVPEGCSQYMLLHYVYFLMLHLGYGNVGAQENRPMLSLLQSRALTVASPLLLLGVIGFITTYKQEQSIVLEYAATNAQRFIVLCWMLVTLIVVAPERRRFRWLALAVHAVALPIGLVGVQITGMRFLVLFQLAAVLVVWLSLVRGSWRSVAFMGAFGGMSLLIFMVTSDLKESGRIKEMSVDRIGQAVDAIVVRAASCHADAITGRSDAMKGLFQEKRNAIVRELLAGVPLSGMVSGAVVGSGAGEVAFDMQFQWALTRYQTESSFFVSGLTALRYAFGLGTALIGAAGCGWLLGRLTRMVQVRGFREAWVVPQAVMVPMALGGIGKMDLLRSLVNVCLFWLLLTACSRQVRHPRVVGKSAEMEDRRFCRRALNLAGFAS